ncbi:MAG: phosphoglucosamine mutase [Eubacteriales bacterium]
MGEYFGTDGIRGVANKDLTSELAYNIARAGGYYLSKEIKKRRPKVVLGTDTRISKDMLEGALISGLNSVGIDVIMVGVIPTPGVAYLTRELNADGGIVISASHNPVEYNGIKFFNSEGYKLELEDEKAIEDLINKVEERPINKSIGKKIIMSEALNRYMDYIKTTSEINLDGLKIALDCGNGAAYKSAPEIFNQLGAEVYVINSEPNGININVNCGSTCPKEIMTLVKETKADIGLSFDGDADRVIAVDENGNIIDGDKIMASLALEFKEEGKLKNNTLVATLMSNLGMDLFLKEKGIDIEKTSVGDRNVLGEMIKKNYIIGGEQSGHIILLDYNTTGDGMLTGVKLAEILKKKRIKSSELAKGMKKLPQTLKNAKVQEIKKNMYMEDEIILKQIKNIEEEFIGKGRVYIRPSGTEPLVRVMIEGEEQKEIEDKALGLVRIIEERLN